MKTIVTSLLVALSTATTLQAQTLIPPKQLAELILAGGGRVTLWTRLGSPVNLVRGQPWPGDAAEIVELDHPNSADAFGGQAGEIRLSLTLQTGFPCRPNR